MNKYFLTSDLSDRSHKDRAASLQYPGNKAFTAISCHCGVYTAYENERIAYSGSYDRQSV